MNIEKLYLKERKLGLKFYDSLKLTFLLHIEYIYSTDDKSSKSLNDLLNDLKTANDYSKDELDDMICDSKMVLKKKYNIDVINEEPLYFKKESE